MKLFISDLDGTLLNSRQQISPHSLAVLKELIADGLPFSIATARSIASAGRILEPLDLKLPFIVHNGVFIYDPASRTNILSNYMDQAMSRSILDDFREYGVKPFLFTVNHEKQYKVYYESLDNRGQTDYFNDRVQKEDKRFMQVPDLRPHLDEKIITMVAIDREENLTRCHERIREQYALHIHFSEDIYSHFHWLELTHEKANKKEAVIALKHYLKADELICLGDNLNDLPMFEAADLRLAVENAHQDVKQTADRIIPCNDEDGVACFLKEYWTQDNK